jgi:hypothetical protein
VCVCVNVSVSEGVDVYPLVGESDKSLSWGLRASANGSGSV